LQGLTPDQYYQQAFNTLTPPGRYRARSSRGITLVNVPSHWHATATATPAQAQALAALPRPAGTTAAHALDQTLARLQQNAAILTDRNMARSLRAAVTYFAIKGTGWARPAPGRAPTATSRPTSRPSPSG
jgi:hypothetical protein